MKSLLCCTLAIVLMSPGWEVAAAPFSIGVTSDVSIGNDSSLGPGSRDNGSGLHARDVATRRRVSYIRYDIAALKVPGEVFKNVSFSIQGQDSGDTTLYGVLEPLDDIANLEASPFSWNTAPGVQNNPTPALDTPVTLDMADLTAPLLSFANPARGVRASTAVSSALAEFLNNDTDGVVIFLLAPMEPGDNGILRSSEYSGSTGVMLEGETGPAIAASDPHPANGQTISTSLTQLCWSFPDPNLPDAVITGDVYFGTAEPNALLPGFGLTRITPDGGITATCINIPAPLQQFKTYHWVVDCHDPSMDSGNQFHPGVLWSFNTNNEKPVVTVGNDQYVWLGNANDPATATVQLSGTATDDGLPVNTLTFLWEQVSGPAVTIDPANVKDITLVLSATGTYQFRLTASDTDLSGSDTVQVVVSADPCLAAQARPGYQAIVGDFDRNCRVDINDVATLAAHWLECNSLQCP